MLIAAMLLAQAVPTHADKQACPETPAPSPAGWAAMTPVTAGALGDKAAALPLGRGARAMLRPAASVKLAAPETRPTPADRHSGLFAFTALGTGRYRVALGAGVWIDVVANGAALPSVAHAHGPACSSVKKMVDFDLRPGRYLLQVTGATTPTLKLMVARL